MHDIVSDCAVFVAIGIDAETGRRMVLGVSVGPSEAAEHWATLIQSFMMRGMNRPNCITSDEHKRFVKPLLKRSPESPGNAANSISSKTLRLM
jgi:transposase-like protein